MGLIRGANSNILRRETAMEMQRRHPGLIYGEVPRRGHVPFLDESEAQNVIGRFIAELP